MTDLDEIAAEMQAHATAETGGVSLHEWTCGYLWRDRVRRADYEAERRQRREDDPLFAKQERERWRRANAKRAAKRRRERLIERLRAMSGQDEPGADTTEARGTSALG